MGDEELLTLEEQYFSQCFHQWWKEKTWKKSVVLLLIPHLLVLALFLSLVVTTNHVPPSLVLMYLLPNEETGELEPVRWGAPLDNWPSFWAVILTCLLLTLASMRKVISITPLDPSRPFDSAMAWWWDDGEIKRTYNYKLGSKNASLLHALLTATLHVVSALVAAATVLHGYLPADLGLVAIGFWILFLTEILIIGFVIVGFAIGFVGVIIVGVIGFVIVGFAVGFVFVIVDYDVFNVVANYIIGYVVVSVVGFAAGGVVGFTVGINPFNEYRSAEEWKVVMTYRVGRDTIHSRHPPFSERAVLQEIRTLQLEDVSSVLKHLGYQNFEEFYHHYLRKVSKKKEQR